MSLDLNTLYSKRRYIGDSSCEDILNKVKTKAVDEEVKADLDKLLDENGKIKPQLKQNKVKRVFRKAYLRFRLIFRSFRNSHRLAIKKVCQIKATIMSERLAKARDKQEKETRLNEAKKAQETAQKIFHTMKVERENKINELKEKLAALEPLLETQLNNEAEANKAFSEAEEQVLSLNAKTLTLSQQQTALGNRVSLLNGFISELKKGIDALFWLPDTRAALKKQYNAIQQDNYPECNFTPLFSNSEARNLIKLAEAELNIIPNQQDGLKKSEIGLRSLIPNAEQLRNARQSELKAIREQVQASKETQQQLIDELKPFETPQEAELAAEKAAAEAAAHAQAAAAAQIDPEVEASKVRKQELLNTIRQGVGGPEGEKFAQLFDALINDDNVRSFRYNSIQKECIVQFKEIQTMWVSSEKYKAGIVMTVGRSDLRLTLSPKKINLDDAKGIDSHGDFPIVSKATIIELELNGQHIKSKGMSDLGSGSETLNFDEMLKTWQNGVLLPKGAEFNKFWRTPYPWKQQLVAGTA